MSRKRAYILVNTLAEEHESGIVIGRFRSGDREIDTKLDHAHRLDYAPARTI